MKFRKKLLISYIFLSVIPITVLGLHSYRQARALLLEQSQTSIKHLVTQAIGQTDRNMNKLISVSDYISFDENIINVLNSDYEDTVYDMYYNFTNIVKPLFNSMMYLQPDITQVTIYNSGNLVRHGTTVLPLENINSQPWFRNIKENYENTWIYDNGRMFVIRKLIGYQSSNSNYLCLYLKNKNLFKELNQITDNYGLYVVDNSGQAVYAYLDFKGKNGKYKLELEQLLKSPRNYIVTNQLLGESDWRVIFYKPAATLHFDISSILKAVLFAIGICIIMLLAFSMLFSKLIVSRIELLSHHMKAIDENNMKSLITSNGKDEIGELMVSFNHMIQKIDTLINEVYQSKIQQKEAEMIALQAQINPHFLYNVLSSINWKAIMISAEEISRTSQLLAKFYRTALNGGNNIISVREELENTKSYIEIQSILHEGSFITVYDINEEIYRYETIKLLLQPIAENAIEHGLDCRKSGDKILHITAGICNNIITFIVEDNGPGIEKETLRQLLEVNSKGYGLKNVNERIKLYYGMEYGVNIVSTPGAGSRVTIAVPAHKPDDIKN
ncbi:MAG: sensor histidine kinase [Anaerocolumna jejuensis]